MAGRRAVTEGMLYDDDIPIDLNGLRDDEIHDDLIYGNEDDDE